MGRGAMGSVVLAKCLSDGKRVAIKFPLTESHAEENIKALKDEVFF
jgi:serine/threonine protein kinase